MTNQIFLANFQQLILQAVYDIEESKDHSIQVTTSYDPLVQQVRTEIWIGDNSYINYSTPQNCDSLLATFIVCTAFDLVYPRTDEEYAIWHLKGEYTSH